MGGQGWLGEDRALGVVEVGPVFEGGEGAGGGGLLGQISLQLCFLRSEVGGMGGVWEGLMVGWESIREGLWFWGKGLEDRWGGLRGGCLHWWGVARSGRVVRASGVRAWD